MPPSTTVIVNPSSSPSSSLTGGWLRETARKKRKLVECDVVNHVIEADSCERA